LCQRRRRFKGIKVARGRKRVKEGILVIVRRDGEVRCDV
jgi:hypothetical protein